VEAEVEVEEELLHQGVLEVERWEWNQRTFSSLTWVFVTVVLDYQDEMENCR